MRPSLSLPKQRRAILRRVQAIQTRAQAKQYMDEMRAKVRAPRLFVKAIKRDAAVSC